MKVILHGATNGSNFGDFLFAKMFYSKLESINPDNNLFYEFPKLGIGKFYRKYIPYTKKQRISDIYKADLLVYFSGGYFGERTNSIKETILRYFRYFALGQFFLRKKKKIAIIGVGGGPITNSFLRRVICKIMNNAEIVIVRDQTTADYFKKYGVKREIIVTTDTVLSFDVDSIPPIDNKIKNTLLNNNKKKILLHMYGNKEIDEKINKKVVSNLNSFIAKHIDYSVYITYDGVQKNRKKYKDTYDLIETDNKYYYEYSDPMQFCSFLKEMDLIITPKLHVGIFSYILSKSILSFPMHPGKTKRFYEMIGEKNRCIALNEVQGDEVYDLLEKYHNIDIKKNEELIKKAKSNLEALSKIVKD